MTTKNKNSTDSENGYHTLAFMGLVMVGLWFTKNESLINRWYFNHYEHIYFSLWAAFLFLVGVAIYFLKKKTKGIERRANLLENFLSYNSSKIPIGITRDDLKLYLPDKDRCSHVQIIGTTGRGKTQSIIIPWTLHDLNRRRTSIIIDGKGSQDIPYLLKNLIRSHGIKAKVDEFSLDSENSVTLNPLKHGTGLQITDRIFTSFDFDDPYYRAIQYDACLLIVRLILSVDGTVTFKLLYELLSSDDALSEKVKELKDSILKKQLLEFLRTPLDTRRKNFSGLTSQLAPFATGELSTLVNGNNKNGDNNEVSIQNHLAEKSRLLIVSIPTLKYQKVGHQLGKLLLQDIAFAVGERENLKDKEFVSIFLDEFSEFAYEGFVSILNKARSAKVALHLSHQSMGDLTKVSPHFANAVTTNTNVKCILGLNDPETADFFARHLGTYTQEKFTEQAEDAGLFLGWQNTGRGSKREVESYKVHPNILKELMSGQGVLHLPTNKGNITEVVKFNYAGGEN
jgi:type IV secretory pathway TraG/TraD family ATPase VirD4